MASAYEQFVEHELFIERGLEFTDEEEEELKKVLGQLKDMKEDYKWFGLTKEFRRMIVRGMWPRKHRTREIVTSIREVYDWRKKMNQDDTLKSRKAKHDLYHRCWPSYVSGEDQYGHWLQLEKVKEISVKALDLITMEELFELRTQHLEMQMEIKRRVSKRLGTRVCRCVYVLDMKDLSITKQFTPKVKNILQPLFAISGDMYPDSLWSLYIINAPMAFRMVWRIVLPWVDPLVRPKIRILGGKKQYLAAMEKSGIPLASIPVDIGGTCETRPMGEIIDEFIENPEDEKELTFNRLPGNGTVDILADSAQDLEMRQQTALKENRQSMVVEDDADDSIFNADEVLLEGYLHKMGNINKAWKKRYFVLTPQNLFYFAETPTKNEKQERGKIELYMVSKVRLYTNSQEGLDSTDADKDYRFDVVTPFRTYYLKIDEESANKVELAREWVLTMSEAVSEEICSVDFKDGGTVGVNHLRSGFLHKRGAFNKMYRKRYFVLTGNGLYYFNGSPTEKRSVLKGKIRLGKISKLEPEEKQKNRFTISTKLRVYHIRAKDEADALSWIQTIREAVDQYKEAKAQNQKQSMAEPMSEVRQIPFVDQVAVLEAEQNFESDASSGGIVSNIRNLVKSAIETAAELNLLTDPKSGERLRGDANGISQVLQAAAGRVTSMFSLVFAPTARDDDDEYDA